MILRNTAVLHVLPCSTITQVRPLFLTCDSSPEFTFRARGFRSCSCVDCLFPACSQAFGCSMDEQRCRSVVSMYDLDGNGVLEQEEFVTWMMLEHFRVCKEPRAKSTPLLQVTPRVTTSINITHDRHVRLFQLN